MFRVCFIFPTPIKDVRSPVSALIIAVGVLFYSSNCRKFIVLVLCLVYEIIFYKMATTSKNFKILLVFASILVNIALGYENSRCSDFGSWSPGCAGPGSVACAVPYDSGAYCIAACYNNVCSYSHDAARDFKNYIKAANNEVHLAIHRNKSPSCSSYDNTFDFVPYAAWYPETQRPPNDRIPK